MSLPDTCNDRNCLQIGYYFVYDTFMEARLNERTGARYIPLQWGIKHWPSNSPVIEMADFGEALIVADELSLQHSTEATTREQLISTVPKQLFRWLEYVLRCSKLGVKLVGFRQWKENGEDQASDSGCN